ncbi:MAG: flagellar biosynthesis protein [Clostridium sp.]|uniref:TIGR02530 family flagellar biosynthesis protein n=1 Tax=Clostridium sp. DSM 8431 TaxID=1761781 RepID=UPI0008DFAE90|nr:TIGR02530 family flagellar biosynthesis protein [Clostridium sp. DSM 8431]MCR4944389.1 flagellar biosynthesis protein [Clostridium sp.]SFU30896.1 flagellar operon protein [Clostridium sp. DSM 8431]
MGYRIINGRAYTVGNIGGVQNFSTSKNMSSTNGSSFKDVLNKTLDKNSGYILSKHAAERINEIGFSENDMENIEKGFKLAEEKGAKNSVMVYKNVALIASIENKTVITAVDKDRAESNVFTNIDSVVLL